MSFASSIISPVALAPDFPATKEYFISYCLILSYAIERF